MNGDTGFKWEINSSILDENKFNFYATKGFFLVHEKMLHPILYTKC